MSLDEFGTTYSDELIDLFGKTLLDKYGPLACEEAHKLNQTSLSEGSLGSYKPQVREVISTVEEPNPSIEDSLNVIESCDKQSSTKSLMVSAMKKYYHAIGERSKGDEFHTKAKQSDIANEAFSGGMEIEQWLTEDEVKEIIDFVLPSDDMEQSKLGGMSGKTWLITHEHRAIFETLYYTGCRVGELPYLQVEDFDLENNNVKVYRLKKQGAKPKRDMIAIPDEYVSTMREYFKRYDIDSGDVFRYKVRSMQMRIKDINDAYQHSYGKFKHAEKLTPHKLRHARVTAIANNAGLEEAGEFVGHSSIDTTKAYRHLSVEKQRNILPEDQDSDMDKLVDALGEDEIRELAEKKGIDL